MSRIPISITPVPPGTDVIDGPRSASVENNCDVTLTEDMYGTGVRVGFYIQAFTQIAVTVLHRKGSKISRGINVGMAASLSVAFLMGAYDTVFAIEYPVFISLMTAVLLPTILEPFFRIPAALGKGAMLFGAFFSVLEGKGSYLLALLVYTGNLFAGVWGLRNRWDVGVPDYCNIDTIRSSISGTRPGGGILEGSGKTSWSTIIWLGSIFGVICVALAAITFFRIGYEKFWGPARATTKPPKRWISVGFPGVYFLLLWLAVSTFFVGFSIVTVEMAIKLNNIITPPVNTLGEIIPLTAGVGSVVSLIWCLLPSVFSMSRG